MTSRDYNATVRAAARNQPLGGTRRGGTATPTHHWKVRVEPAEGIPSTEGNPQWRVFIGVGTVNDRVAAITYKTQGDPRGWVPSDSQLSTLNSQPTTDRLLTERDDPPYLLLTAPAADSQLSTLNSQPTSDFERIPDDLRARHPSAFRTREMWDLELWTAVVYVTAEPVSSSIAWDRLGFPFPTRNGRFRIAVRPRMPAQPLGTQLGGAHQLATLYLTRAPGEPERDTLYVQQRTFWSLWTANADINPFGNFDPFLGSAPSFGGIGGGIVDSIAQGTFATIDAITGIALGQIAELYSEASSVQFWTA